MMDQDLSEKGSGSGSETTKKSCSDCQTSKTPLWRGGPAGPKSLCNACGIRYRKKRRALLGLKKESSDVKKRVDNSNHHRRSIDHHHHHPNSKNGSKLDSSLKLRLLAFGREVLLQGSSAPMEKQRRQLGEEEQAAVLLMALSCGSVSA